MEEKYVTCEQGQSHKLEAEINPYNSVSQVWVKEELLVNEGTNDLEPEIKEKPTSLLEKDHCSSDQYKEGEITEKHEPIPQVWVKQEIKQEPHDPSDNIAEAADEQQLQSENMAASSDEWIAENENVEKRDEGKDEEKTESQGIKSQCEPVLEQEQSASDIQVPDETERIKYCCRQNMLLGRSCDICKRPGDIQKQLHKCEICGKRFSKRYRLKTHLTVHGEKNFQCDVCSKCFVNQRTLHNHKQFVHCDEKKFICPICGKGFSANYMLKRHTVNHTGERKYACSVCNMSFKRSSNLVAHLAFHTGEKKFQCTVCSKRFHLQSDLTDHERLHTGERAYKCEVCKKDFFNRKSFANHVRVHSDENRYKCDLCQKQFVNRRDLGNHERLHTGEKPYKCDICKKDFFNRGSLQQHLHLHLQQHTA